MEALGTTEWMLTGDGWRRRWQTRDSRRRREAQRMTTRLTMQRPSVGEQATATVVHGVQFDEEGGTGLGWTVETTVSKERERSAGDDAHPTQRRNDGRPATTGNGTLAGWRGRRGSERR
ncbi:hypothetical protein E2562_026098 [Oryza meyeriana var. granulata]|uniref:DUF834 domain-containing protein n=1 Tax=Oryza meyeriana var. granulata TaxID=110450 RepID=A0A6G1BZY9_9ORYZ|nr:hypothetical protein E2562_026098 [Oryza meyeriana var. granulata]